ncbi:MAG TPA: sigma-70 family RNA polymerase sigma factor [Candidatus Limnocylindria bacterium]|nr:sigma-70 family RNA polymerase sigma factor [Candidatus Limnocylindria bacterium]
MTAQLWERCRAGDANARAELIERYMPLARALSRRVRLADTPVADGEDLASAGLLGLIDAVDRFEPGRGVPFEAYASLRIRGAIIDELRRVDERGRRTTPDDRPDGRRPKPVSLDGLVEEEWQAFLATADTEVDDAFEREDLRWRVQIALDGLPTRQREVLARYYAESLTLRETGVRMGISEARACQLHGRAIANLRRALDVRLPRVAVSASAAA